VCGLLCCIAWCSGGCGYRPLLGPGAGDPLSVKVVRTLVPDAVASDEVAAGIRDEFARAACLAPGAGYPRVEVEVLAEDEGSRAIAAVAGEPVARATAVGIVARAWIVRQAGAAPEADTGDMRAEEVIAVDETAGVRDPKASALHTDDGLRAAARRLGQHLARRLMGLPASGEASE
jgi:hypothetical protein